jgi:CRISPR system Cascade subunit CasD
MQSWGQRSRFNRRDTALEPTKSGIVGLLMAALGCPRDDDATVAQLARLRLGVRVDREGTLERDYHTVAAVPDAAGSNANTVISYRYYLADAVFLAVLEGDQDLILKVHEAVARPYWPLYLGRRAFVPGRPLIPPEEEGSTSAVSYTDMETVLREHRWLDNRAAAHKRAGRGLEQGAQIHLRTVIDSVPALPETELRYDQPISFRPERRQYAPRAVLGGHVPVTAAMLQRQLAHNLNRREEAAP